MDIQELAQRARELFDRWSYDNRPRSMILDPETLGVRDVHTGDEGGTAVPVNLEDWTSDEIDRIYMGSIRVVTFPAGRGETFLGPDMFKNAFHFDHAAAVVVTPHSLTVVKRPEQGWPFMPAQPGLPWFVWDLGWQMFVSATLPPIVEEVEKETGQKFIGSEEMEEWQEDSQRGLHALVGQKFAEKIGAEYVVVREA